MEPIYERIEGRIYGDFEYYLVSADGKVGVLDENGSRITKLQFDKKTFYSYYSWGFNQDRFYRSDLKLKDFDY